MHDVEGLINGRKVKQLFDRSFKAIREKYGLKLIEVEILMYLNMNVSTSMKWLIETAGLNKGQVSKAVDNLSKLDMIQVSPDVNDRRKLIYTLLPKGKEVGDSCTEILKEMRNAMTKGVSEEERILFCRIATTFVNNLLEAYPDI